MQGSCECGFMERVYAPWDFVLKIGISALGNPQCRVSPPEMALQFAGVLLGILCQISQVRDV